MSIRARVKFILSLAMILAAVQQAQAGHSRHPYCDGGESPDGRFTVTVELVEIPQQPADKKAIASYQWKFTWTDTETGLQSSGVLAGLRSGKSSVFEPVHAHIFVQPGGETFTVWNPNVLAPADAHPPKDLTTPDARDFAGFTHRLTIYKATGEIVKRLDLKDFLLDGDWQWLFCYGAQVYW